MRRLIPFLLLLCSSAAAQNAHYVNGQWFDGTRFVAGDFYSVNGVLTHRAPRQTVEAVDLGGGYVVPAFADAHNHMPESQRTLSWAQKADLDAGIFYVLNPNDIAELSNPLRGHTSIDILFAHAGFTGPHGHPRKLYDDLAEKGYVPYHKGDLEGRAFYPIANSADVDRFWPAFIATKPDLTKIYFLYSETADSEGLTEPLAAEIVRRSHRAGIRVGAHIETAADYRNALRAGVDFIMHLPGYNRHGLPDAAFVIPDADIAETVRRRVFVVTTTALIAADDDPLLRVQTENLRRLQRAGVRIILGSDRGPGSGLLEELDHLHASGVFTNLELLRMISVTTPQALFPGRKIGRLESGYEASFLVLRKNPLDDLNAVKDIAMRVKSGALTGAPERRGTP